MDVRSRTIDVMGLRTRVLESGDASARESALLIHGVGAWAEVWRDVMEPIAATGRRAIAFDLPGFGESDPPGRVSHFGPHRSFYATFVPALLDALEVQTAHLVGSSMGGSIAYIAAVEAPERTRSLSFISGGGLGTSIAVNLRVATLPGSVLLARLLGRTSHARAVLRSCFFDASRIPEQLYEEIERYGLRTYPEFVSALRSGVTLRGVRADVRAHWIGRLSRYSGPVLIVWGREDAVLPVTHVAHAKDLLPQAQVRIIERCGHLPMVERTEEFLGAFLPFIDGAEGAAAA